MCMEKLTDLTLFKALSRCRMSSNYKVLVVMNSLENKVKFVEAMYIIHKNNPLPGVTVTRESMRKCNINFANGSCIEAITLPTNTRGRGRCHEVLYGDDINIDNPHIYHFLHNMICRYETPMDTSSIKAVTASDSARGNRADKFPTCIEGHWGLQEIVLNELSDHHTESKELEDNNLDDFLKSFNINKKCS